VELQLSAFGEPLFAVRFSLLASYEARNLGQQPKAFAFYSPHDKLTEMGVIARTFRSSQRV
jgi:hypothetical protein